MDEYWVPHDELVWAPGKLPEGRVDAFDKVSPAQLQGVPNICNLDSVGEGAVLHTVRARYDKGHIYTGVARILVAVNPFQTMAICSEQHIDSYLQARDSLDMDPHVYGICLDAVNGLRKPEDKRSQVVLISGESGAGKTETTKLVLSFMTKAASGSGGIQDRILQTNAILEAFGNAMTERNNNSSRFGKWLEISLSPSLCVSNCSITDYLLERTRVCTQSPKERNFHIFLQVVQAKSLPQLASLGMLDVEEYRYLKNGLKTAPGIDDADEFEKVKKAFGTCGFSEELQMNIFKVLVALLFVGNVEFKEIDSCEHAALLNEEPIQKASDLLGLEKEAVASAITTKKRSVKARGHVEETITLLSKAGAEAARDALSRQLYGGLFKFLIEQINKNLVPCDRMKKDKLQFGVLDIAGFESFQHNSLEQLFINFSNERMQLLFNNYVFKDELEAYHSEGVAPPEGFSFDDNWDVVDLIGKGILMILDDQSRLQQNTDDAFARQVHKTHGKHPRLIVPKILKRASFGIKHFAGEVSYSCDAFLEKNANKPSADFAALFAKSRVELLRSLGMTHETKTVGAAFRASLDELMGKLENAEPHFIRCVKPNEEKVPNKFTSCMVLGQLRFSGIFEAVRIRKQGYASRQAFDDFWKKYKLVLPKEEREVICRRGPPQSADDARAMLDELTAAVKNINRDDFLVGKTKVLGTLSGVTKLDKCRDEALLQYVLHVQKILRGCVVRRRMKEVKEVASNITAWVKDNDCYSQLGSAHTALEMLEGPGAIDQQVARIESLLKKAQELQLPLFDKKSKIDEVRSRMEGEARLVRELKHLLTSPDVDDGKIKEALVCAKRLGIDTCAEAQDLGKELERRIVAQRDAEVEAEKNRKTKELKKLVQRAIAMCDFDELTSCLEEAQKRRIDVDADNVLRDGRDLKNNLMSITFVEKKLEEVQSQPENDHIRSHLEKRRETLQALSKDRLQEELFHNYVLEVHTEEEDAEIKKFALLGRNTLQDLRSLMREAFRLSKRGAEKYVFFKDPNENQNDGSTLWRALPNESTVAEVSKIEGRLVFGRMNVSKSDVFPANYAEARHTFLHARKQFLEYNLPLDRDVWQPITEALFAADKATYHPSKQFRGENFHKNVANLTEMMACTKEDLVKRIDMLSYIPRAYHEELISEDMINRFQTTGGNGETSLRAMKNAFELMCSLPDFGAYVFEGVTFYRKLPSDIFQKSGLDCASSPTPGWEPGQNEFFPQGDVSYTLFLCDEGMTLKVDKDERLQFRFETREKSTSCHTLTNWKPLAEDVLALGLKELYTIILLPKDHAVAFSSLLMRLKR